MGALFSFLSGGTSLPNLYRSCALGRNKGNIIEEEEDAEAVQEKGEKPSSFVSPSTLLRPRLDSDCSSVDTAGSFCGSRAESPRPSCTMFCSICADHLQVDSEKVRVVRSYGASVGDWVCSEKCWRAVVESYSKQEKHADSTSEGKRHLITDSCGNIGSHRGTRLWKSSEGSSAPSTRGWISPAEQESCAEREPGAPCKESRKKEEEEHRSIWTVPETEELVLVVLPGD